MQTLAERVFSYSMFDMDAGHHSLGLRMDRAFSFTLTGGTV